MSIASIESDVNIAVDVFRGHEPPRKGYVEYRIVSLVRLESSCRRIVVWRRYSEFFRLRSLLLKEYGSKNVDRIVFPPKSLTGKYDPEQLESRRRNLHLFMNECVATLPVRTLSHTYIHAHTHTHTYIHTLGCRTYIRLCKLSQR